jgi:hypothetical protein
MAPPTTEVAVERAPPMSEVAVSKPPPISEVMESRTLSTCGRALEVEAYARTARIGSEE